MTTDPVPAIVTTPKKGGRPPKMNNERCDKYIEALELGAGRMKAAEMVDVSWSTVRTYEKTHPEFVERVNEALQSRIKLAVDSLFAQVLAGNTTATIFFLQNRDPDEWADRRGPRVVQMQHSGTIEMDVAAAKARAEQALGEWKRSLHAVPELEAGDGAPG